MMSKKKAGQRMAEIRRELMKSIDYRALNSFLPANSVSSLVYEILEVENISEELQIRISKVLGERWLRLRK